MKRILTIVVLILAIASCEKETENTMLVSGNIKGLKKGTLFLQQFKDSSLVVLDSLKIEGDGNFSFSQEVENPDIFYLYLEKEDQNEVNDRILFFGEPGQITINTSWNTFDLNPEIMGSKSHETLSEFNEMLSKFNLKDLTLMQEATQPKYQENTEALDSLQRLADQNLLNRYRYVLNFGLNNGDSYATPYIMIMEAQEANPKYLDSVYRKLSPEVAASKYGKALQDFLKKQD
ncbi:DUF4369 domain-containing protein [Flagellimonas marina]|uniref:DUF4369 domain-containing protein n=1 Tax=Flagellimonas marina TaxID=1775168 RepID=A0ABV8PTB0_9FLAO